MPPFSVVRSLPGSLRAVAGAMGWSGRRGLDRPLASRLKSGFDVVMAAWLLLLLCPLFLVLMVLIKRDGGTAFFSHRRIGRSGREFGCLKFRSMVPNSREVLDQLLAADPAASLEWEATQKLRDDPRVTRLGRILRRTSLDEIPQLLNVVRGEMSLVGPRPIVAEEVPRYGDRIVHYYAARPGLTGLWQVNGRSNTSYEHRVELDCRYVQDWTLRQDFAILARTFPVVLNRKGAH